MRLLDCYNFHDFRRLEPPRRVRGRPRSRAAGGMTALRQINRSRAMSAIDDVDGSPPLPQHGLWVSRKESKMKQVMTIGLDIAKSVFQVHGVDAAGHMVLRQKLSRGRMLEFFAKLPRCLVGIERRAPRPITGPAS